MTPTTYIALALGLFFLFVLILKGFKDRAERRRLDDIRSAALNGGTPDAPIHLESPFAPQEQDAPADPDTAERDEESYVWE